MNTKREIAASHKDIYRTIRHITRSKSRELSTCDARRVKQICSDSTDCCVRVFDLILVEMRREHAHIRLRCLHLLNTLFLCSHTVRLLVLRAATEIVTLAANTQLRPTETNNVLRGTLLATIGAWSDQFRLVYPALFLLYRYVCVLVPDSLRVCAVVGNTATHRSSGDSVRAVREDVSSREAEIHTTVRDAERCIRLIVPEDALFQQEEQSGSVRDSTMDLRVHGISSGSVSVKIGAMNINTGAEIQHSLDRLESLVIKLRTNLLPFLTGCQTRINTLRDKPGTSDPSDVHTLQRVLENMTTSMRCVCTRYEQIRFLRERSMQLEQSRETMAESKNNRAESREEDEEEAEFEAVDFEPDITALVGESTSVPRCDVGRDAPHCGYRMSSGRRCRRRDARVCPFHGPIVPRDSHGDPVDPQLRIVELEKRARSCNWQDQRLLDELYRKTGVDMKLPSTSMSGGRARRSHHSDRVRVRDAVRNDSVKQRLIKKCRQLKHSERIG